MIILTDRWICPLPLYAYGKNPYKLILDFWGSETGSIVGDKKCLAAEFKWP